MCLGDGVGNGMGMLLRGRMPCGLLFNFKVEKLWPLSYLLYFGIIDLID